MGWKVEIKAQEDEYSCGPVTIGALMGFNGIYPKYQDVFDTCGCSQDYGTSHDGVIATAQKCGFKTTVMTDVNLDQLRELVKEQPVMIGWTIGGVPHFSIATGVTEKSVCLADCDYVLKNPRRYVSLERFEKQWWDTNTMGGNTEIVKGWLMIIKPR